MRKFSSAFLGFCIGFGASGCSPHADPDPTTETKVRLLIVPNASQKFHIDYSSWPTGLHSFIHRIAFLPGGGWTTNDAWGHPLVYRPFDSSFGYGSVSSLGRDDRSEN